MYEETIERLNAVSARRAALWRTPVLIIVGLFALMFIFAIVHLNIVSLFVFIILVIYGVWFLTKQNPKLQEQERELTEEMAEIYMPEVVKPELDRTFDDIRVAPREGIEEFDFGAMGLYAVHDIYHRSERVSGSYNGIRFDSSHVTVIKHHHNNSKNTYERTFAGRVFVFDLPVRVDFPVKIITEKIGNLTVYRYQNGMFPKPQKTFDEEFDKKFSTYCNDTATMSRVLSPTMTETLLQIHESLFYLYDRNKKVRRFRMALNFAGDKLFLQIENAYDGFRCTAKDPDIDEKLRQIEKDIEAMTLILDAVDSMR